MPLFEVQNTNLWSGDNDTQSWEEQKVFIQTLRNWELYCTSESFRYHLILVASWSSQTRKTWNDYDSEVFTIRKSFKVTNQHLKNTSCSGKSGYMYWMGDSRLPVHYQCHTTMETLLLRLAWRLESSVTCKSSVLPKVKLCVCPACGVPRENRDFKQFNTLCIFFIVNH